MKAADPALVLLVDDDLDIRSVISSILEGEGYAVACAANGQEALDYLASAGRRPDLILLDLMMPVMDGATFRERQRQVPAIADIPVVIFSAFGASEQSVQAAGAVARLPKPLSLDALLTVVARHL